MIHSTVYPETANRSLESIDVLFSTDSPFHWAMERAYRQHGDILADMDSSDGPAKKSESEPHGIEESVHNERV